MTNFDHNHWPQHGWLYREQFNGKWWNAPDPSLPFLDVAALICSQRKNNGIKSTFAQCAKALEDYTKARLGWTAEGVSQVQAQIVKAEGCAGCGRKRKR